MNHIMIACSMYGLMENKSGVDIKKYENSLGNDYSNALLYHNYLITANLKSAGYSSDHTGASYSSASDTSYFKMMFNTNDSLFSRHFYDFCMDMMKNGGMMGISSGMMGSHGNMMGSNSSMMNGSVMGSSADMETMMNYMDSVHFASENGVLHDYLIADSLIYNQMSICKMMTNQTYGISSAFEKMQSLRRTHTMLFGKQ